MPTLTRFLTSSTTPDHRSNDEDDDRFSQCANKNAVNESSSSSLLSIANAIERHQRNNLNDETSTVDVVAVILSVTNSTPSQDYHSTRNDVRYIIGDTSLSHGQCARVIMAKNSSSSSLYCTAAAFRPGDVVRWNRLEVRRVYDEVKTTVPSKKLRRNEHNNKDDDDGAHSYDNDDDYRSRLSSLSVTCDLSTTWRDPEAGPIMAKLCHIIPTVVGSLPNATATCGSKSAKRRLFDDDDDDNYKLIWESNIPSNMETRKNVISDLARWYACSGKILSTDTTPSTNVQCRRFNLREITSPNVLCHVVVKVLRCERMVTTKSDNSWGATTFGHNTHTAVNGDAVVTHVTLSDGPEMDDLIGMGAADSRRRRNVITIPSIPISISSVLIQSMEEGSRVLLTHVLSRTSLGALGGGGGVSTNDRGSLSLVPTSETTASILTPDHPYYIHEKCISPRIAEDEASQLVSVMSRQHDLGQCHGVMAIEAPLMDIIVDGIRTSFMEGLHWQSPNSLSAFLVNRPSASTGLRGLDLPPIYRSATLILDPSSVASNIVVNADGDAMKLLCLDVPVLDMVIDSTTPNPYLTHVGCLLLALCTEKAPIRWILEQQSERGWFVTNATLINI